MSCQKQWRDLRIRIVFFWLSFLGFLPVFFLLRQFDPALLKQSIIRSRFSSLTASQVFIGSDSCVHVAKAAFTKEELSKKAFTREGDTATYSLGNAFTVHCGFGVTKPEIQNHRLPG
jgi:hypothetical protein